METSVVPVKIPLLNPNEPEAKLVSLAIEEGQYVKEGDLICTLETTKSTADLVADRDGYVIGVFFAEGETVKAGAQLCFLSDDENWQPDIEQVEVQEITEDGKSAATPAGLRISKPALILAQTNNLDLNKLPVGPLVTESLVQEFVDKTTEPDQVDFNYDSQELIVYGGGGTWKICDRFDPSLWNLPYPWCR